MAISHWLVPLAPDDPVLTLLAELEAEFAQDTGQPKHSDSDEDDPRWAEYVDALSDHPRAIDMWVLGGEINTALAADLDVDPREFIWTDRVRQFACSDAGITYLEPEQLRTTVEQLSTLTADEIGRRITTAYGSASREEVVERTVEVLNLMRRAAADGLGLLIDFSP